MESRTIGQNEAGQRFDKYLTKYLSKAPLSFIYKMLRKKNITLNGKKAQGNEKLSLGDEVKFFLADETLLKFKEQKSGYTLQEEVPFTVIYENDDVCFMNKPAGILSQKSKNEDVSMIEYFTSYLIKTNKLTPDDLETFHPAVANRLDRNTSGIIIGGKTLAGLQEMSEILKNRNLHKYYICLVDGVMEGTKRISGYLTKSENHNKVTISDKNTDGSYFIETQYRALGNNGKQTLVEVLLLTGRSHQIRAHLSSIGHPIIGDGKYGNPNINKTFKRLYGLRSQFLHSYRLEMPVLSGTLKDLSGKKIVAGLPDNFTYILKKEGLLKCLHGIQED